jgi:hypothetical protein
MAQIFEQANKKITAWAKSRKADLQQEMSSLGITHRKGSPSPRPAQQSIKDSTRKKDGLINRIGYNIPRHMVYVHKGVGRGTPIEKAGTTKRKAKPWFNPVIDRHINSLADTVAEELGSALINNLFIK